MGWDYPSPFCQTGIKIPEFQIPYHKKTLIYKGYGGIMSGESKTVATLKGQLSKFSGIISKRFRKLQFYFGLTKIIFFLTCDAY